MAKLKRIAIDSVVLTFCHMQLFPDEFLQGRVANHRFAEAFLADALDQSSPMFGKNRPSHIGAPAF